MENLTNKIKNGLYITIAVITIFGSFMKMSYSYADLRKEVEKSNDILQDHEYRVRLVEKCTIEQTIMLANIQDDIKDMVILIKEQARRHE